jgi:hypothetical protein
VVFGGASAGFDLGCTVSTTNPADSLALTGCDQTFRSVEWSWLAGGGVQWNLQGVSLGLEARYMKAITSFVDSPLDPRITCLRSARPHHLASMREDHPCAVS